MSGWAAARVTSCAIRSTTGKGVPAGVPEQELEAGYRLGDGRHVAKEGRALRAAYAEGPQPALADMRQRERHRIEGEGQALRDRVVDGIGAALVGHVDQRHARGDAELLAVHVRAAADSRRAVGKLAGLRSRGGDQLRHRADSRRGRDDQHHRL